MPTDTEICSAALALIGASSIASFSAETREAEVCSQLYTILRDGLLADYPWRFAIVQARLNRLVDTPLFGFRYAFNLPPYMLRLIGVKDNRPYQLYQNKLYCDDRDVYVQCVAKPSSETYNETQFPPYFTEVLILKLAYQFGGAVAADEKLMQTYYRLYEQKYQEAKTTDSQQYPNPKMGQRHHPLTRVRFF